MGFFRILSFPLLILLLTASLICAQDTYGDQYVLYIIPDSPNSLVTCGLTNIYNPPNNTSVDVSI